MPEPGDRIPRASFVWQEFATWPLERLAASHESRNRTARSMTITSVPLPTLSRWRLRSRTPTSMVGVAAFMYAMPLHRLRRAAVRAHRGATAATPDGRATSWMHGLRGKGSQPFGPVGEIVERRFGACAAVVAGAAESVPQPTCLGADVVAVEASKTDELRSHRCRRADATARQPLADDQFESLPQQERCGS